MCGQRERLRHVVRHDHDGFAHALLDAAELADGSRPASPDRARRRARPSAESAGRPRARVLRRRAAAARRRAGRDGARQNSSRVESDQTRAARSTRERNPPIVPAEQARHRGDVLGDAQVWKQPDFLHDVARPAPELERVPFTGAARFHEHVAGVREKKPVDQLEDRALPGAASANQRERIA